MAHVIHASVRGTLGSGKADWNHCSSTDVRDKAGNVWPLNLDMTFSMAVKRITIEGEDLSGNTKQQILYFLYCGIFVQNSTVPVTFVPVFVYPNSVNLPKKCKPFSFVLCVATLSLQL